MKKTLVICERYPLPDNVGTSIRTMNFVRYFKKYGSVDLAYSKLPSGTYSGDCIFSNEFFLERQYYPRRFIARVSAVMRGQPYPINSYSISSEKMLLSIIESNNYDHILVRYVDKAYCLFNLPTKLKKRIIIDFDDILSTPIFYYAGFKNMKKPYKRVIITLNRWFLTRYEKKCRDLNLSLFCSKTDSGRVKGNNDDNVFIVPNVYSNKSFENYDFEDGFNKQNTLLFVGSLAYSSNVKGLQWFVKSVYQKFKREYPDTKLLVVGHSPGEEVIRLCQEIEGVELHPNVPDVKQYYKGCKALVVPLLWGAGTRIKILEAALANRPVLSTPLGAEGLDLINGKHLLLFQGAEEFSLRFKEILDREKYASLVRNSKEFVIRNYSIENFSEVMNKVLQRMD